MPDSNASLDKGSIFSAGRTLRPALLFRIKKPAGGMTLRFTWTKVAPGI